MTMNILKWLDLRRLGFATVFLSFLLLIELTDSDFFWHLRTGQYLFEQGALPSGDIFSYTREGQPWVLHEWLFELVLYCFFSLLGEFGIKLLVAALATSTLIVTYWTANRFLSKPYIAFFLAMFFFILVALGISPRPQLVTYLMLAVYLRILTGFKYFGENRGLIALPPLMAIWVNFHGGYVAGLALLAVFTACEWLKAFAAGSIDTVQRSRLRWLSLTAVAALLASLANPYFFGHWLYPFQVMGMEASRTYISEWRSPDFHSLRYQGFLALVFAYFIVTIYRKTKADATELAVPLFFASMGFVSVRHIPLAAITLIPFVAMTLTQQPVEQMIPARWLRSCTENYGRIIGKGKDLGNKEYLLNWLLFAFILAALLIYYPFQHARSAENAKKLVPVEATEFIIKEGIRGRMLNTYHYGGYLIYRLYPEQKVFIDGRADMYGDAFMKEYIEIAAGGAKWRSLFDKYKIDYLIIQRGEPLRQLLLEKGNFKLVHEDEVNSVLLRNTEKYAKIIAKHSIKQ